MEAKEFVREAKRMCHEAESCHRCPGYSFCEYEMEEVVDVERTVILSDEFVDFIEKWSKENKEGKNGTAKENNILGSSAEWKPDDRKLSWRDQELD